MACSGQIALLLLALLLASKVLLDAVDPVDVVLRGVADDDKHEVELHVLVKVDVEVAAAAGKGSPHQFVPFALHFAAHSAVASFRCFTV